VARDLSALSQFDPHEKVEEQEQIIILPLCLYGTAASFSFRGADAAFMRDAVPLHLGTRIENGLSILCEQLLKGHVLCQFITVPGVNIASPFYLPLNDRIAYPASAFSHVFSITYLKKRVRGVF
jgi:hypothetical protein